MKWTTELLVVFVTLSAISGASAPSDSEDENPESLKIIIDKLFEIIEKQDREIQKLKVSSQKWEGKMLALESRLTQQDSLLALVKAPYPKNCEEIRLNDDSKESGIYLIDPDGHGIGDGEIQVYCNMTTGTTFVSHNRQNLTDVGNCKDPGCFSQDIKYQVSLRQIAALIEQSSHCHQLIEYQCFSAPLAFNGIQYSWWEDRYGHEHYFWSGSEDSGHKCQCQENDECYDPSLTCNCDSVASVLLNDTGLISNKTLLPITRVHFGRTFYPLSSGQYRLGQLECRGFVRLEKMPESCSDLKKVGHSLSGFYYVRKSGKMATVYCDMAKLPGDSDLERVIGTSDKVYFYVQLTRSNGFGDIGRPISFDVEMVNVGRAMNLELGNFTAPIAGIYHFSFMFRGTNDASVVFLRNGSPVWQQSASNYNSNFHSFSHNPDQGKSYVPAILDLDVGDQIQLVLQGGLVGNCHFVGMLLHPRDDDSTN